ncbi:MAG: hypothetical protein NTW21_32850 [Verrucomicrobia bacterium]|nr:hypothetical protein [Verrucomicrobiota bacterium]
MTMLTLTGQWLGFLSWRAVPEVIVALGCIAWVMGLVVMLRHRSSRLAQLLMVVMAFEIAVASFAALVAGANHSLWRIIASNGWEPVPLERELTGGANTALIGLGIHLVTLIVSLALVLRSRRTV